MYESTQQFEGDQLVSILADRIVPTVSRLLDQHGADLAATVLNRKPTQLEVEYAQQALLNGLADLLGLCNVTGGAEEYSPMLAPHQLRNAELCREWLTDAYEIDAPSAVDEDAIQRAIAADEASHTANPPDAPSAAEGV